MRLNALLIAILSLNNTLFAHTEEKSQASIIRYDVKGCIVDKMNNTPIEFATVFLPERNLWSISNEKGEFIIHQVPEGKCKVHVSLIGYQSQEFEMIVSKETPKLKIFLQENNLLLDEVVVTAQANKSSLTTSYNLDRTTLDHAQIKTVGTIGSLLPGGKTSRDGNLSVSNPRIALRAGSNEMGNASFGTAVAIDGVRLENNATMDETKGVGLRNVSISNIESVEIISGIPSVEYGDLSNGFVKIQTKKGRTPFMIEFSTEPKTKLIALSKGFFLGHKSGTLNASFERAKSTSNLASPYTAYDRNAVSFLYANTLNKNGKRPLSITANINGNLGGYDSKADPDAFANNYKKNKDYSFRGNIDLNYQLNQPWITSLSLNASASYADKLVEESTGKNSSSTQPLIHALDEGYYIATNYDINPNAPIILGPTGYWNEIKYVDSKPINYAIKIKANWAKSFGVVRNKLLVGLDYTSSGNGGQGVFYDDMRYTPTWRRYRYYELPFLNNCAAYVENGVTIPTNNKGGQLKVTAGLRSEMTLIKESVYGTTNSVYSTFQF
jgi:Outer membrane cobalamin receptor protein